MKGRFIMDDRISLIMRKIVECDKIIYDQNATRHEIAQAEHEKMLYMEMLVYVEKAVYIYKKLFYIDMANNVPINNTTKKECYNVLQEIKDFNKETTLFPKIVEVNELFQVLEIMKEKSQLSIEYIEKGKEQQYFLVRPLTTLEYALISKYFDKLEKRKK